MLMSVFSAEEMLRLHSIPLYSVNGYSLEAGELTITGLALAAEGQAKNVKVGLEQTIAFEFDYPLPSEGAKPIYWYWKNSENASYRLRIKLADTTHEGAFFPFQLIFAGRHQDKPEKIRTTNIIPKNLSLLQNYPSQSSLKRVQFFETISSVATRGASDAYRIAEIAQLHGVSPTSARILDWGMGHGRVARFLHPVAGANDVHGIDIDPENITWAQQHLPQVASMLGPLNPPTIYEKRSFDLIYGISVMTHLVENVQRAWLEEISRILRPGGLALLTFAGDSAVAFSSQHITRDWFEGYTRTGRGILSDNALAGVISDAEYYKNVKVKLPKAVSLCSEYMDVKASYECMFGYQDLIVMGIS